MSVCATCSVWTGLCPDCGTFWFEKACCGSHPPKRYAVRLGVPELTTPRQPNFRVEYARLNASGQPPEFESEADKQDYCRGEYVDEWLRKKRYEVQPEDGRG